MSELYSLEFHGNYIHITYPSGFVINPTTTQKIWADLANICKRYDCEKVLIEASKLARNFDTMAAFDLGVRLSNIKSRLTVALCFFDYERDELGEFLKTVARNRGTNIEFFLNADDAKKWLGVDGMPAKYANRKLHPQPSFAQTSIL